MAQVELDPTVVAWQIWNPFYAACCTACCPSPPRPTAHACWLAAHLLRTLRMAVTYRSSSQASVLPVSSHCFSRYS